jgi:phage-related protein
MPTIGPRCHELRVADAAARANWRIVYRADPYEVLVIDVFAKTTRATPGRVIAQCKERLRVWDQTDREGHHGRKKAT